MPVHSGGGAFVGAASGCLVLPGTIRLGLLLTPLSPCGVSPTEIKRLLWPMRAMEGPTYIPPLGMNKVPLLVRCNHPIRGIL